MKRNVFALLRTFVFAAFVPALAFSLVACEPENGGTVTPDAAPEVTVPDGYVNYFIEDLSFSHSVSEAKVVFQINVSWTMVVDGSPSWCSVEPASGAAGLHKVKVRVTDNNTSEPRSVKIYLLNASSNSVVAEIDLIQERKIPEGAVDLGLSVLWASCNVGAESPEEYGDYFAWGETTTKSSYSYYNSVTQDWSISMLKSYGIIGADGNLTSAYDAATANWGDKWRMPTLDEMEELDNQCTWKWTTQNGVNGYKVTGPNGNSIFLPAAGHRSNTSLFDAGSKGDYWSGSLDLYINDSACSLRFFSNGHGCVTPLDRYAGYTVRPVTE